MGRQCLLVCLLFGFLAAVSSQTTDDPVTVEDSTTEGGTTGPQTTWLPSVNFQCYHCSNEPDNDECNGLAENENATGTLAACDLDEFPDPVCYTLYKFNERGNGFSLAKGCMDYEECEEAFYGQMDDPLMMSCLNAWYFYNPPPTPGNVCTWCCWKYGKWNFDKCNKPGYLHHYQILNDGDNMWDHKLDQWPGHEKAGYTYTDDDGNGASGLGKTTLFILFASTMSVVAVLDL